MKNPRFSDSVCFLLIAYCLVLSANVCLAEIPHLIRYQGQAVDSKGVPLEGPYSLTFRLYDAETGGNKLWEEAQTNIQLSGGNFSVLLGQKTPLTTIDWAQSCWLSMQVNEESELSPRQQITSVPLAVRAETAERLTTSLATSTITDDDNSLVPSGAIVLWTGSNCPAGYTRFSSLDGKFLVGGSSYNTSAGGIDSVTPSGSVSVSSHSHTVPANQNIWGTASGHGGGGYLITLAANENAARATNNASTNSVAPSASFSGSTFDNRPSFATVLLCKKD